MALKMYSENCMMVFALNHKFLNLLLWFFISEHQWISTYTTKCSVCGLEYIAVSEDCLFLVSSQATARVYISRYLIGVIIPPRTFLHWPGMSVLEM